MLADTQRARKGVPNKREGMVGEGAGMGVGVSRCKLLSMEEINDKVRRQPRELHPLAHNLPKFTTTLLFTLLKAPGAYGN